MLGAFHIISHAKTGDNSLDNGLLLQSDIDEHVMTLANDGKSILVQKDVKAPEYNHLKGTSPGLCPSTSEYHLALLSLHNLELGWVV